MPQFVSRSALVAALSLLGGAAWAQPPAFPGANPAPPEPLEIYERFFHFHEDFDNRLQNTKLRNPARASRLDASAARYFQISQAEMAPVAAVTRDSAAKLRVVHADERAQALQRPTKPLAPADRNRFQQRRQAVVEDGIRRLKASLSPASWSALQAYVEGAFGSNLSKIEPGKPKP